MFIFFHTNGKLMKGKVAVLVDAFTCFDFVAFRLFENGKYLYNSAEPLAHLQLWAHNIIDKRKK